MAPSVLVTGSWDALVRELAEAHRLTTDSRVVCLAIPDAEWPPEARDPDVHTVWFVVGGFDPARHRSAPRDARALRTLLASATVTGVREVNIVGPDDSSASAHHRLEKQAVQLCGVRGVDYRVFRVRPLVDHADPADPRQGGLAGLLAAFDGLRSEVVEHVPDYFEHHPVRLFAPADANADLLYTADAARLMTSIAEQPASAGRCYPVGPAGHLPVAELCARISATWGVRVLPTDDPGDLTAIDRLLAARTGELADLRPPLGPAEYASTRRAAGTATAVDGPSMSEVVHAAHRRPRGPEPVVCERRRVAVTGLDYDVAGPPGRPLVLLNALGQGSRFWSRLIDRLAVRHPVITWEPRGFAPDSAPMTMAGHVDDVEAVLRAEGHRDCVLVGWCTGPKIALEFQRRRPDAVASMVFLAGSFKHLGHDVHLDTDYEHNLERLCRTVLRQPRAAERMVELLDAGSQAPDPRTAEDHRALAEQILAMTHPALREDARAPFRTPDHVRTYAQQLLDFWSHDPTARAEQVRVPVLFVESELDRVASPARFRAAAARFPRARHVLVPSATHYCLYDRPDLVAGLIDDFLDDPDSAGTRRGEQRWSGPGLT